MLHLCLKYLNKELYKYFCIHQVWNKWFTRKRKFIKYYTKSINYSETFRQFFRSECCCETDDEVYSFNFTL